jgi:galactitol-specific phosphotransferase system IIC component
MIVGFVLGFTVAYISSIAITAIVSQSIRAASSLAKLPEVAHLKSAEVKIKETLFDELRCI